MADLILGIDGGGTTTDCIACNLQGEIVGKGTGGPSNHQTIPWERAARSLIEAIEGSLGGCRNENVISICGGMAGVDWPGSGKPVLDLFHRLFPQANALAVPDVAIALHAVTEKLPGVIVISGTGAMGYGEDAEGKEYRASGWGYLLGDEGSGYHIGRKGLQAATQAFDGRGPQTRLVEYACESFKVGDLRDILDIIYGGDWSPDVMGDFTPYVVKAADADDEVSRKILQDAGESLAMVAVSILRQMDALDNTIPVGLVGGVFAHAGPILHKGFSEALQSRAPKAITILSQHSPILGALVLAYRKYGGADERGFRRKVAESLHRS